MFLATSQMRRYARFTSFIMACAAAFTLLVSCGKSETSTIIDEGNPPKTDTTVNNGGGGNSNPPKDTTVRTLGITTQQVVNAGSGLNQFVLFLPKNYNTQKTKRWPVIIALHGIGERGSNINIIKNTPVPQYAAKNADFGYIVVAPQCKDNTWWDVPSLRVLYDQIMSQYNVDSSRVYLTGLSMGGYGVWDWAQKDPGKFAAIVPICGGGTPNKACPLKSKPIWVFHNADDPTVNVNESRTMVKAVKDCGNTIIKYTENTTGGHDAWTKAYNSAALYEWLNQQHL
ncbi:putative esterase [Chitinophaga skermanii]|uniref:Putative esterase n=1 Tax=Chitinophaga skermanii TaxID=331697 RepID=A0A327Q5J4_9BACT|nr:alpha/beta hydrolase-fold protein [Chitinophaga skermanii]RAI98482.1 putative esterase [Chitinophaga skermanii]